MNITLTHDKTESHDYVLLVHDFFATPSWHVGIFMTGRVLMDLVWALEDGDTTVDLGAFEVQVVRRDRLVIKSSQVGGVTEFVLPGEAIEALLEQAHTLKKQAVA